MPRNYPAFIIDRSRRSEQSKHTDDFIICTDDTVGFIARAYKLNKTQFEAHDERIRSMPIADAECRFVVYKIGSIACILEVIKLIHPPLVERARLKSLLAKAVKAYIHGEVDAISGDGSALDRQISVVSEMRRLSLSQYDNLVLNNGSGAADAIISDLGAAIDSLELLKKMLSQFDGEKN